MGIIAFMKNIVAILIAAAMAAGCVSSQGGRHGHQPPPRHAARQDDSGIKVEVLPSGRLELYRHPVTREKLLDRLREEKCDLGARAVIIEGARGAHPSDLLALRSFLVANRIPRVMVAMPPEERAEIAQPPPPRRHSPHPAPSQQNITEKPRIRGK